MIRRNIGIAAIIVLLVVAFLDYDSGNADKRASLHKQAADILDAIRSQEELLKRIPQFQVRLDWLITELARSKDVNEEHLQIYNRAIQDRDELLNKQEAIETKGKQLIEQFTQFGRGIQPNK
jgi:hypothetical protein